MTVATRGAFSRGGPYTHRDPLVHGRADVSGDPIVVLDVVANFWPITVDWDEGDPEVFAFGETVDHTYLTNATFSIVLTDPRGATDTFDVVVAGVA